MIISETRILPLKTSVNCLFTHGDHIFVGTGLGCITVYALDDLRNPLKILYGGHKEHVTSMGVFVVNPSDPTGEGTVGQTNLANFIAVQNNNGNTVGDNFERKFLYTAAHDNSVCCWDLSFLNDDDVKNQYFNLLNSANNDSLYSALTDGPASEAFFETFTGAGGLQLAEKDREKIKKVFAPKDKIVKDPANVYGLFVNAGELLRRKHEYDLIKKERDLAKAQRQKKLKGKLKAAVSVFKLKKILKKKTEEENKEEPNQQEMGEKPAEGASEAPENTAERPGSKGSNKEGREGSKPGSANGSKPSSANDSLFSSASAFLGAYGNVHNANDVERIPTPDDNYNNNITHSSGFAVSSSIEDVTHTVEEENTAVDTNNNNLDVKKNDDNASKSPENKKKKFSKSLTSKFKSAAKKLKMGVKLNENGLTMTERLKKLELEGILEPVCQRYSNHTGSVHQVECVKGKVYTCSSDKTIQCINVNPLHRISKWIDPNDTAKTTTKKKKEKSPVRKAMTQEEVGNIFAPNASKTIGNTKPKKSKKKADKKEKHNNKATENNGDETDETDEEPTNHAKNNIAEKKKPSKNTKNQSPPKRKDSKNSAKNRRGSAKKRSDSQNSLDSISVDARDSREFLEDDSADEDLDDSATQDDMTKRTTNGTFTTENTFTNTATTWTTGTETNTGTNSKQTTAMGFNTATDFNKKVLAGIAPPLKNKKTRASSRSPDKTKNAKNVSKNKKQKGRFIKYDLDDDGDVYEPNKLM